MNTMRRRGFTLIELITVMAISAILLGLIVAPLFQSFNLTRAAQSFAEAQDRARILTERVAREVGNSAMVRGAGGVVNTSLNGDDVTLPINTLIVRVPRGVVNGGSFRWPGDPSNPIEVALPYTRLDMVRPAEGDPTLGPNGGYVDPVTGKEDPTLQAPKGQVNLPAAPGMVMVRYFVALRDPFAAYNNPYDGLLMTRGAGRDNLYVLYRAEIVPYVRRAPKDNPEGAVTWRPNLDFFESDDATDTQVVGLDDPRFMLANMDGPAYLTTDAKADRIRNWLERATIQTDVSRYDMILPVYDKGSRAVQTVRGTAMPQITPLIQFRPSRINSDQAQPMLALRPGEETDDATAVGSDVYVTQYGLWGNAVIRVFPQGWTQTDPLRNDYLVAHRSMTNPAKPMSVYVYDPNAAGGGPDFLNGPSQEIFDINRYDLAWQEKNRAGMAAAVYPFSEGAFAANASSGWLSAAAYRRLFTPLSYDRNKGRIITSFGIDEVGTRGAAKSDPQNLPSRHSGPELTPTTDTDTSGNFFDQTRFGTINRLFNKIFADYPSLRAANVHRFLDLRLTPQSDGTPSPLHPSALANQLSGFTYNTADGGMRSKVTIVPGSDVVFGPDQNPGPNYGREVRYTRIARGEPGPNQYRINYADQPEPTNAEGQVDYRVLFPDLPASEFADFNARTYDAQNLISAVLQPRFKVGYIHLYSGSDLPLPTGLFRVYYKFQFTGTRPTVARDRADSGRLRNDVTNTDMIAVDYDTRQLMDVLLTIRNYPQSSLPNPQTVTLKSTATVRNYTR